MSVLDDALYDYLEPALNLPTGKFMEAHSDHVKLVKPYATWMVLSNPQVGEVLTYEVREDGNQLIAINKAASVQVDFYGEDSNDLADMFLLRMQGEDALYRADQTNLGLLATVQPVDTSAFVGDTWERRFSVRLTISNSVEMLQQVGIIEKVEIEGTYHGGAIDPASNVLLIEDV